MPHTTIPYLEGGVPQSIVVRRALSASDVEKLQEYLQNDRAGALRMLRDVLVSEPVSGLGQQTQPMPQRPQTSGPQTQMPMQACRYTNPNPNIQMGYQYSNRPTHFQTRYQVQPCRNWRYSNGFRENRPVDNELTQAESDLLATLGHNETIAGPVSCPPNSPQLQPQPTPVSPLVSSKPCECSVPRGNPFGAVGDGRPNRVATSTSTPTLVDEDAPTSSAREMREICSMVFPPLWRESSASTQVETRLKIKNPETEYSKLERTAKLAAEMTATVLEPWEEPIELLDYHKHPTSTEAHFARLSCAPHQEKVLIRFPIPVWCDREQTFRPPAGW